MAVCKRRRSHPPRQCAGRTCCRSRERYPSVIAGAQPHANDNAAAGRHRANIVLRPPWCLRRNSPPRRGRRRRSRGTHLCTGLGLSWHRTVEGNWSRSRKTAGGPPLRIDAIVAQLRVLRERQAVALLLRRAVLLPQPTSSTCSGTRLAAGYGWRPRSGPRLWTVVRMSTSSTIGLGIFDLDIEIPVCH